jgi:basic membrane protein A
MGSITEKKYHLSTLLVIITQSSLSFIFIKRGSIIFKKIKGEKKMKRFLLLLLVSTLAFSLVACSNDDADNKGIAIITSAAGANDNGYNEAAIDGAKQLEEEFDLPYHVVETDDIPGALESLADEGYELIFSLEYNFDALISGVAGGTPIAEQYPDTTFVVFNAEPNKAEDGSMIHDNVISVLFDVHEGSFLAGALSVQVIENADVLFGDENYSFADPDTEDGRAIGFIGGTQSAGITVFSYGFAEGIDKAASDLGVDYTYYADYAAGFGDPATGSTLANTMYNNGVNVVYSVAGVVGDGVTSKAAEVERLAIQVDADKDDQQPGYVLTSVLKNTNVPVYDITKEYIDGTIGDIELTLFYSLGSGATGITDLSVIEGYIVETGQTKWEEIKTYIEGLSDDIADGTITVTDAQRGEELDSSSLTNVTVE